LGRLMNVFRTEPVVAIGTTVAAADALLALGVAFGAPVTVEQKVAIDSAITAVLGVVAMLTIRSQVTPVAALPKPTPAART
jgi:hypothetical protein